MHIPPPARQFLLVDKAFAAYVVAASVPQAAVMAGPEAVAYAVGSRSFAARFIPAGSAIVAAYLSQVNEI